MEQVKPNMNSGMLGIRGAILSGSELPILQAGRATGSGRLGQVLTCPRLCRPPGRLHLDRRIDFSAICAEWADSTRFSTTPRKGSGYDTAEVDAFRQEIRDTFLGVLQPPLTLDEARDKRFRMARRGYKVEQVDAFCDEAEQRLAAMRPTYRGRRD